MTHGSFFVQLLFCSCKVPELLINLVLLTYTTALTHICLWSHRFQGPCQLTHEPFKY